MLESGKSEFQLKLLIYYIIVYIYSVQVFYTLRLDSVFCNVIANISRNLGIHTVDSDYRY